MIRLKAISPYLTNMHSTEVIAVALANFNSTRSYQTIRLKYLKILLLRGRTGNHLTRKDQSTKFTIILGHPQNSKKSA